MPDNKQVVQKMFTEIINDGNLDLVDELFDEEFTSQTPQGMLDRDGFKQYVASWRSGFPDIHCEVDDLIQDGDQVAWSVRATGTTPATSWGYHPLAEPWTSTVSTSPGSATAAGTSTRSS
jgi:predicted SnoaL-like aldol condensation-catalyzing enzyme